MAFHEFGAAVECLVEYFDWSYQPWVGYAAGSPRFYCNGLDEVAMFESGTMPPYESIYGVK